MSDIWLRLVERLVRTWTRLYTIGVAPDLRDRRRAEIESDLWESRHQPQRPYTAAHVLLRLLLGVRDDVAWRSSCRRPSKVTRAAVAGLIAGSPRTDPRQIRSRFTKWLTPSSDTFSVQLFRQHI